MNAGVLSGGLVLPVWVNPAAVLIEVATLCQRTGWFAGRRPVWALFGWLGFAVAPCLMSFPGIADDLLDWPGADKHRAVATVQGYGGAETLALLAWSPIFLDLWGRYKGRGGEYQVTEEEWLVLVGAILVHIACVSRLYEQGWALNGILNLVLLALAAAWLSRGRREERAQFAILGSLLLAGFRIVGSASPEKGGDSGPESLAELGQDYLARFRFKHRPPSRRPCAGLSHADVIWQGPLSTRNFSPSSLVD